jgi:hypothetical protein
MIQWYQSHAGLFILVPFYVFAVQLGAPMKGDVVAIKVQPGDMVVEGQVQPLTALIFRATSVADPDPGSGAFLTPRFGIGFFPDPGSQAHIFFELSDNFWGKKFYHFLKIGQIFFLQHFKSKIILTKKYDNKFFSPLSFVAVFGSGVNIPDPQH